MKFIHTAQFVKCMTERIYYSRSVFTLHETSFLNFFNDSYFLSETFHIKELVFCHFIKDATDYCNRCPYVLGSQSQIYSDISCPHKQSDDQNIDTSLTVTMKLQELKTWINHHRERKRLSQRSCTIKLMITTNLLKSNSKSVACLAHSVYHTWYTRVNKIVKYLLNN